MLAKIQYLIDIEFGYTYKFSLFWQKITRRETKAQLVRDKLLEILKIFEGSLKKEVGAWMEEYDFWATEFEMRRGRRLIRRI